MGSFNPKINKGYNNVTKNIDSELPSVSSSDNGSILQVVNGVWTKIKSVFDYGTRRSGYMPVWSDFDKHFIYTDMLPNQLNSGYGNNDDGIPLVWDNRNHRFDVKGSFVQFIKASIEIDYETGLPLSIESVELTPKKIYDSYDLSNFSISYNIPRIIYMAFIRTLDGGEAYNFITTTINIDETGNVYFMLNGKRIYGASDSNSWSIES